MLSELRDHPIHQIQSYMSVRVLESEFGNFIHVVENKYRVYNVHMVHSANVIRSNLI